MNESEMVRAAREITDLELRGQFLDQACADNPEMRARIEKQLARHDQAAGHDGELTRTSAERSPHESPPSQIGPYKILQQIGEGGMGTVYLAEQTSPVRRRVALKIIKAGMDSKEVVARFESERQAISLMDHPNIAKILDAGTTQLGRPYFVMERVQGLSLTEYCEQQPVSIQDKIQLFCAVCNGVHHAHQRGIIHRDLKPSNILVTEYEGKPTPKIIDFGLAKALNQQLTEKTLFTHVGQVVGTYVYMSPEQSRMNAMDIDIRSDIYSLGVILYELLTGTTPFDRDRLRQVEFEQILKIIREEEPQPPSTRLSAIRSSSAMVAGSKVERRRVGSVSGELDWIALKALEKDRNRRYESALGFARDLHRHLEGDPVEAAPASVWYRGQKFVRRHKIAVVTSSIVILSLFAGVIGTSIGLVQANQAKKQAEFAKNQAEDRSELARDALDLMSGKMLDEWLLTSPELTDEQSEFLQQVIAYYDKFAEEETRSDAAKLAVAEANKRLGDIHRQLGENKTSISRYEDAVAIISEIESPTKKSDLLLGNSLVAIGRVHATEGNRQQAFPYYSQARSTLESLANEFPDELDVQLALAEQQHGVAFWRLANGEFEYGRELIESLVERLETLLVNHPDNSRLRYFYASTLQQQAYEYRFNGKKEQVVGLYEKAIRLMRDEVVEKPSNHGSRQLLAVCINDLGVHLKSQGEFDKAKEKYEEAFQLRQQIRMQFPNGISAATSLAGSYLNLGNLNRVQGNLSECEQYYVKGIEQCKWVTNRAPRDSRARKYLRNLHEGLAEYKLANREFEAAIENWEQAIYYHQPDLESAGKLFSARLPLRRCVGLAWANRIEDAQTELTRALKEIPNSNSPAAQYHVASVYAAFYSSTADAKGVDLTQREAWASKAIEHLKVSLEGEKAYSSARKVTWLDDPELDPLRELEEFQRLIETHQEASK